MIMINTKDVLKAITIIIIIIIITDLVDQELVGADVAGQVLEVTGDQEVVTVPTSLTLHRSEADSTPDLTDISAPNLQMSSSHHHHHYHH